LILPCRCMCQVSWGGNTANRGDKKWHQASFKKGIGDRGGVKRKRVSPNWQLKTSGKKREKRNKKKEKKGRTIGGTMG